MVHKSKGKGLQLKTKVDFLPYWKQTTRKINGKNRKVWVAKQAVFPRSNSVHGKIVYRTKMVARRN